MKQFISDIILPTTVVGSYPSEPKRTVKNFFDPWSEAVKKAVDAQINAGINIISDGQVRGDMISVFASKLPGVRGKDVIGKVMPPDRAITVKDTIYAAKRHPYVKAIITGPSTLAHGLHIDTKLYRNRDELIPDIASALITEARALEKTGAVILQIDEPIFSTGAASLKTGRNALEMIKNSVSLPVCLHVCGNISRIIDELISMPVQIIDFESSQNPDNLASFSGKELKDRYIGYGVVDSVSPVPESEEEIKNRIIKGVNILGPERIILDPDCGLRMQSPETAYAKLKRLSTAAKTVRDDL
jgi:5-methyltetrahydropteroyltriglutamate--homocysteine methyltransferase